jgi:hypothetical protein
MMGAKAQYGEYLEHVQRFLNLDLDNTKALVAEIKSTEKEERVKYSEKVQGFSLGLVVWPVARVVSALREIQLAIEGTFDFISENGAVNEENLSKLNAISHDLKIRYFFDEAMTSHMKLGYDVPDSRLAWEEAKCPHCGETVTLHIFPDPIPLIAYDALINTLRLISRSVHVKRCKKCRIFFIPGKANQIYHSPSCRGKK